MTASFGLEFEYCLIKDGVFCDYTNTNWLDIQKIIDNLPDYSDASLRRGDMGIRQKRWYVDGDERFDEDGKFLSLSFKGIEARTPTYSSIEDCLRGSQELKKALEKEATRAGYGLAVVSYNPFQKKYEPNYNKYEMSVHERELDFATEISTLTYGPDLNFSFGGSSDEDIARVVDKLTYYSPYIVPLSFYSPFFDGKLSELHSVRTFYRTGQRLAVRGFVGDEQHTDRDILMLARSHSEVGRIEFKSFDAVTDSALQRELFYLVVGIALSEKLTGSSRETSTELHKHAARQAYEDAEFKDKALEIITAASEALTESVFSGIDFSKCLQIVKNNTVPSMNLRERFMRGESIIDIISV